MGSLRSFCLLCGLSICAAIAWTKEPTAQAKEYEHVKPLTQTVGVLVAHRTENPDKSLTLMYRWFDRQLDRDLERSVIVNEDTVIGINGELGTLAEVTDEVLNAPSVATVGEDGVTAVLLRIGRDKLRITREQLTPRQIEQLEAVAPKATEASNKALDERVAGIVAQLKLEESEKEARVRDIVRTHLAIVRDNHNAGFAPPREARENLNKGLNENLTPEQVEQVKESMTFGQMMRIFSVYHEIVPQLTAEHDEFIMAKLREGREAALDIKNVGDVSRAFEASKTEIEHYITAQGYDWRTYYKAFVASRNEGQAAGE